MVDRWYLIIFEFLFIWKSHLREPSPTHEASDLSAKGLFPHIFKEVVYFYRIFFFKSNTFKKNPLPPN